MSTEVSAPIHLSIVRVSERVVRAIAMKRQQAQETMNMWLRLGCGQEELLTRAPAATLVREVQDEFARRAPSLN